MPSLDLNIDSLSLRISNAAGHEHRIRPIVSRAAAILAERAEAYFQELDDDYESRSTISVSAVPVNLDLRTTTDEYAANDIARAWMHALTLNLK